MNNANSLDEWASQISGSVVDTLTFAFCLMIYAHPKDGSGSRFWFTIETPFVFTTEDSIQNLDPLAPITLAPILALLGQIMTRVVIEEDGVLTVEFENKTRIEVHPHDQFEAWQVGDETSKAQIICQIGGGLT